MCSWIVCKCRDRCYFFTTTLLTGPIPVELEMLSDLQVLDLSHNNLTGETNMYLGASISLYDDVSRTYYRHNLHRFNHVDSSVFGCASKSSLNLL